MEIKRAPIPIGELAMFAIQVRYISLIAPPTHRSLASHIGLTVPGAEIVVNHEPTLHSSLRRTESEEHAKGQELSAPHKDVYVAIRDAFKVTRRKLQEYSHRRR